MKKKILKKLSTADGVCAMRGVLALDKTHPMHKHFNDPYASKMCVFPWKLAFLFTPYTSNIFKRVFNKAYSRATALLVRSFYSEKYFEKYLEDGVDQLVIIGAGFDSFCLRRKDIFELADVFELDIPQIQKQKIQRLKAINPNLPKRLNFIEYNLLSQSLDQVLSNSPFDRRRPVFFSILGVSYYISQKVFINNLKIIRKISSLITIVAFDYLLDDASLDSTQLKYKKEIKELVDSYGESMIYESSCQNMEKTLENLGYEIIINDSLDNLYNKLFKVNHPAAQPNCYAIVICEVKNRKTSK